MPNRIRFTDLALRALKPQSSQETYWDHALPAFGIRVGQRSKTFLVVRDAGRRVKVGRYPTMSLQEARREAKRLLSLAQLPASSVRTTKSAVALFLDTRAKLNRPATKAETERLLNRHLLPSLGDIPVDAITTDHIASIIDGLVETPGTATHVFTAMQTFFNWSVARRFIQRSPIAGVPRPAKVGKRDRVLTEAELASIYNAAVEMGYPFGTIVLLAIHTGMRRGEIASLKWSYITSEYFSLPGELTKNHQQHLIPNLVGDKLQNIPRMSDYLFPSGAGTPFSAWSKNKAALDARCGVRDWVLHDLRRTFSTKMAEWQIAPPHVIERILNHIVGSMTPIARIYNRWNYLSEMKEAMRRYEERLGWVLKGSSHTSTQL